jgi:hypothetical protein
MPNFSAPSGNKPPDGSEGLCQLRLPSVSSGYGTKTVAWFDTQTVPVALTGFRTK